jgi:type IV secretory pathway VirB2 component (pilin)
MKTLHRAARVERPNLRPSFSGFLLLTLLLFPLAAHAQTGSSPFDTGLTSIQTLFTGTIAKVSSLIAIVLGGYLKPAGIKLGLGPIGWHTFRHTYRSWLDETGAPMKVQQELMRHASIQTTMNVYGQALPESKREANGKVVTMVLKPLRASA